jgi:hypothetical protein
MKLTEVPVFLLATAGGTGVYFGELKEFGCPLHPHHPSRPEDAPAFSWAVFFCPSV